MVPAPRTVTLPSNNARVVSYRNVAILRSAALTVISFRLRVLPSARQPFTSDGHAPGAGTSNTCSVQPIPNRYRDGVDLRVLRYFATVAEEGHFGRSAARLHMTQPPLSRAIKQLEDDLGVTLLDRTPKGVTLTAAGQALYDEARSMLEHAGRLRAHVMAAAGAATLAIGTLADTAEHLSGQVAAEFSRRHPHVDVTIREADLTDPTAGLRAGLVDVALTRMPFDDTGIVTQVLRSEPVGVVLRDRDPLAQRTSISVTELAGRRWVRLPDGTDPVWAAYWTVAAPGPGGDDQHGMRTIQECLQSVLWNGMSALAPMGQLLPPGLVMVRATDRPPSQLVVAWNRASISPLIRSFIRIAATSYRPAT
jgi:DNA-binding transcriptional LysR family regulator